MKIDRERWARLDELFHVALAQDRERRGDVLDQVCGDDAELRAQVEALLRGHDANVPVLDAGPAGLSLVFDGEDAALTERIGPYRIVRELGRGGMGVVYQAERDNADFRQIVALKRLLPGVATPELIERFRRERRILAALVHANIAQLHDGGVTEAGDPYFVMEFVDGERLDRYCDGHALGIEQRLRLFATVCDAVQYAHQHLVVHRDLKPGNVLVTASGDVKLLDFGIAKLLEEETSDDTDPTVTTRALTPAYASPEQVRGEPATATSDVFSLGLILFELLTGRRAFPAEPWPLGPMRAVVETEAARASTVVEVDLVRAGQGAGDIGSTTRASARGTTPDRLRRRLRGDLDTILERALRTNPSDRYASAQALVDDVRRHLDGLPIRARRTSARYRLTKFVRRHRMAVAGAATAVVALVAGLSAAVWQGRIAARERDAARAEAAKAERVTDFLVSVFDAANPSTAPGEELTARQILDRGARRIEAELASEPIIQATIRREVGRIYATLAEYREARSLIERSLAQHRQVLGEDHAEVGADIYALAAVATTANPDLNRDSLYRVALEMQRRHRGAKDWRVGQAMLGLGLTLMVSDTLASDTLMRRALAMFESEPGRDVDRANALNNLGLLNHSKGNYPEAERRYREALEVYRSSVGEEHPAALVTMSNMGSLLRLVGRLDAADSVLQRTLVLRRRILGERHTGIAAILVALGEVANLRGAYADAERYFTGALEIRRERLPNQGTTIADNLQMLAGALAGQGRYGEAHVRYREALATLEAAGAGQSPTMARALSNQAGLLVTAGDYSAAASQYRRAWQIYRRRAGDNHAFTAIVEGNLGRALLLQDSLVAAEPHLRNALAVLRKAYSENHQSVGAVLIDAGTIEMRKGELAVAEQSLRRALEIVEGGLPHTHWRVAQAKVQLGRCLTALDRPGEAEPLLLAALDVLEKNWALRVRDRGETLLALEQLYTRLGRSDDARRYRNLRNNF